MQFFPRFFFLQIITLRHRDPFIKNVRYKLSERIKSVKKGPEAGFMRLLFQNWASPGFEHWT